MGGWREQTRWWGRQSQRAVIASTLVVAVLGLTLPDQARGIQTDIGTPAELVPEPTRRAACDVPDPANPAPLTDGTEGIQGVAAGSGAATPNPEAHALQAGIDAVVHALAACLSTGEHETVAALATGRYLGLLAGTGGVLTDDTYVALARGLPTMSVTIRAIEDTRQDGPQAASADVLYVVANQLVHGRWFFVRPTDPGAESERGGWLIDGEEPLPVAPPPDAVRIEVELDEYEIDLERSQVSPPGGALVLAVRNAGEREHELLVLRLEGAAEAADLLGAPGPELPEGFSFAGQVTLPPGGQAELILVDLPAGRYALVSLLPDEEGVPDLERGMEAELRVG